MKLQEGSTLQGGKYRIEGVLGQGGFGITYLAEQVGLNRQVAIKEFFMKEYCNRDETTSQVSVPSAGSKDLVNRFKAKFIKEAQTIAKLKHPNIIRIYDIFEENGTAYYVMEYHGKGSLSELLKSKGKLPESEALRYIRQVADALSYIHENKMNHLDVKPGNILLDEEGNAVLIDFGVAKQYDAKGYQTSTTPVGISHGYAPMEQYKKGGVSAFSPATDIYSLGATLYKLITGETPPEADEVNEEGLPELPVTISKSVRVAIESAMQPKRKDRPQSIAEFLQLLERNLGATQKSGTTFFEYKFKCLQVKPKTFNIFYYPTQITYTLEALEQCFIRDGYKVIPKKDHIRVEIGDLKIGFAVSEDKKIVQANVVGLSGRQYLLFFLGAFIPIIGPISCIIWILRFCKQQLTSNQALRLYQLIDEDMYKRMNNSTDATLFAP